MNKTEKRTEIRNLLIYFAVTFGISWGMFFAFLLSGKPFINDDGSMGNMADLICTLGMLSPAAGVIITRHLTKEGYKLMGENSLMLGIDLKNGKIIFYILALLLPWLYSELGNLMSIIIQPECFDTEYFKTAVDDVRTVYFYPVMAFVSGVYFSFGGLGEELGWRSYMMPKLIKLCGLPKAVIIGGIIWGIWHWPLTYAGHNFGTEYKGYPFTGFAAMAVLTVFMGILLTYVTIRTGSVWPAAFLHAVNNASPSILQFFINPEKISGIMTDRIVSFIAYSTPMIIISIAIITVFCIRQKKISVSVKDGLLT
ncbi:MAG: CPBP family intramembrane metalloprotease [Clostridia bacterium]|nr:CPBP family intramembrane metalloprotease [Clostridia bacterium]